MDPVNLLDEGEHQEEREAEHRQSPAVPRYVRIDQPQNHRPCSHHRDQGSGRDRIAGGDLSTDEIYEHESQEREWHRLTERGAVRASPEMTPGPAGECDP